MIPGFRALSCCFSFLTQFIYLCYIYIRWALENIGTRKSDSVACLVGKSAIVTGGNSGIGYATSVLLASRGCRVIIACRSDAKKEVENIIKQTGNANITAKYLDLCSLKSVRAFANDINHTESKIDILINNAGVVAIDKKISEDGLNVPIQTNYLGGFLLTHLLLEPLKASGSARIVFVTSAGCYIHSLTPENLNTRDCDSIIAMLFKVYPNGKMCNVIAAQEFARKMKKYGIMVNSSDPGVAFTPIFKHTLNYYKDKILLSIFLKTVIKPFAKDIMEAAQTHFHLATSENLKEETGQHYLRCRRFLKPYKMKDQNFIDSIWVESEALVKLTPKEKLS